MIISHTIQFGSRKWRINLKNTCFLECHVRPQWIIFLVSCVRPLVSHVRPCGHGIISCPYSLVLIFNVTIISCSMLRPLSCLTMFCDHNFSLLCGFHLQFSQNYINIDTDEIQHWFCYFVQSLWNKNTTYERSNGRTFYHIFIPYTYTFFFLFHIVLYTIMWSTYNPCTYGFIHTNLNTKWRLLFKKMTSVENACRTRNFMLSKSNN